MTDKYTDQAKLAYNQINMSHDSLSRLIDSLRYQDKETQIRYSVDELRNVRSILKSARLRLNNMLPTEPMIEPINTKERFS